MKPDSTIMKARQPNDENATLWKMKRNIMMNKTWQYDDENATVRWWKCDSSMMKMLP